MKEDTKIILKLAGFVKEIKCIEHGFCPVCKNPVSKDEFKDEESKKEYEFSGMCQKCIDGVFITV